MVGALLSQYFENNVIQSEGRAILQNWSKVKNFPMNENNKIMANYSSNYLAKQRKTYSNIAQIRGVDNHTMPLPTLLDRYSSHDERVENENEHREF